MGSSAKISASRPPRESDWRLATSTPRLPVGPRALSLGLAVRESTCIVGVLLRGREFAPAIPPGSITVRTVAVFILIAPPVVIVQASKRPPPNFRVGGFLWRVPARSSSRIIIIVVGILRRRARGPDAEPVHRARHLLKISRKLFSVQKSSRRASAETPTSPSSGRVRVTTTATGRSRWGNQSRLSPIRPAKPVVLVALSALGPVPF